MPPYVRWLERGANVKYQAIIVGLLFVILIAGCVLPEKPPWYWKLTGTDAGNVDCSAGTVLLDTAGAAYTMNASSTVNGVNCFNVTAANVSLDCNGFKIIGNITPTTNGIYTNQFNTTIKNCNVSNFTTAIYFDTADNGTIQNTSAKTTSGYGIYLYNGANYNLIDQCYVTATTANTDKGIYLLTNSSFNTIRNTTIYTPNYAIHISGSSNNNVVTNVTATSYDVESDGDAVRIQTTSANNLITNSTLKAESHTLDTNSLNTTISNVVATAQVYGISFLSSSSGSLTNSSVTCTNGANCIVLAPITTVTVSHSTVSSTQNYAVAISGTFHIVNNVTWVKGGLSVTGNNNNVFFSTIRGATLISGSSNGRFENNTFDGRAGAKTISFTTGTHTNNTLINNTIYNGISLLDFDVNTGTNTICLNNFSSVGSPTTYVNDLKGTNFYNCTYASKKQGNIYANVLNGSVAVQGTVNSSITGLYIGTQGAGFPYSNSTSGGKFSCNFAGCADYAPLTPQILNSCTCPASPANWSINLADSCNITNSCSIPGYWLIYNGTGTITYNNSSTNITISAKGETLTNIVGTFYEKILSMLIKNYTS